MKLHIDCRCGCDVMVVEKIIEAGEGSLYYFNMYRGYAKSGFWRRLKQAWKYFRKGEFAYSDMTIETPDLDKLITFLMEARSQEEEGD